jgi:hypothetical protein
MLAWVADTLMPQGTEVHTKVIDAAIDLLQQRVLTLGSSGHHSFDLLGKDKTIDKNRSTS